MIGRINAINMDPGGSGHTITVPAVAEDHLLPAHRSEYLLTDARGLEPVKAEFSQDGYVGFRGAQISNIRVPSRNIVLTIEYAPRSTPVAELRRKLFDTFTPGSPVHLDIYQSGVNASVGLRETKGIVESVEAPIFSGGGEYPEAQVSIICPDPYFYGALHDHEGSAGSGVTPVFNNPGLKGVGLFATIHFRANTILGEDILFGQGPGEDLRLQVNNWPIKSGSASYFITGDVVTIDTRGATPIATLTRSGGESMLYNAIMIGGIWPRLKHGNTNRYTVRYFDRATAIDASVYVEFQPGYLGF